MNRLTLIVVCAGFFAVGQAAETFVVQDVPGYNSWPMIETLGDKLVCVYSRGSAHTICEGKRGVWARTSSDGGKTWTPETLVVNAPTRGEVTEGAGRDSSGAVLFWVRSWGGGKPRHDLYRSEDGIAFKQIAALHLDPAPMQITDIFRTPKGLMALWFQGKYRPADAPKCWGTVVSVDEGRTWTQRTVEKDLPAAEWPTEQAALALDGGKRILVVARSESGSGRGQFQLISEDGGETWRKSYTNIRDVAESTPSLIFDAATGLVSNYYYQRGPGLLKRRVVRLEDIFTHPEAWPEPEVLAKGGRFRPYDSGNVNAVALKGAHYAAWYTGDPTNTSVVVTRVGK